MPTFEEKVDQMDKKLDAVVQLLGGYKGQPGLCADFEAVKRDHYDFKRKVYLVLGVLIGSGVIGLSGYQIALAIAGGG